MIPLMKNAFYKEHETKKALAEFISKSTKLSMDVECFNFEKKFAKHQGSKYAVLFNSGGSANLAILQSLKNLGRLKEGDKIGFSALTWSTNVMPIIQLGFEPVPVDCSDKTLNVMSSNLLETIRKTKIKALFITNVLGFAGDLEKIKKICERENIILLEDNCESLGTKLKNNKTGNFGLCSSFSFFVAHHMSTIEGGMVCSNDEELVEMLTIVRANGWDRNLTVIQQKEIRKKHGVSSEFIAKYTFYDLAFNLRPTEITGFLGSYQLDFLDENIKIRDENYKKIEKTIVQNDDLILLEHNHINFLSSFAMPIICKTPQLRDFYVKQFSGAGIEIRPIIAGNMQEQPFYKKYVKTQYNLKNTEKVHSCGFYCGNYPELTESDLNTIQSCLTRID